METVDWHWVVAPASVKISKEGFEDIIAVMNLPRKYCRKLRTSNRIKRLNE